MKEMDLFNFTFSIIMACGKKCGNCTYATSSDLRLEVGKGGFSINKLLQFEGN